MSSENLPVSDEDGDLLVASVSVITVQESAEGDGGVSIYMVNLSGKSES
jgi:hypothetical protein